MAKRRTKRIQAVIFDRDVFKTVAAARKKLKQMKFNDDYGLHTTQRYYRFRQSNPKKKSVKRTITLSKGIKGIYEIDN